VDGNLCALGGLAALQRAASSFGETDSEERRAETDIRRGGTPPAAISLGGMQC